jgi:hypothetical protein
MTVILPPVDGAVEYICDYSDTECTKCDDDIDSVHTTAILLLRPP